MIRFENVYRSFKGKLALNNVSFNINKGEATAIVGPNGAGKTTIINLLLGFLKPDSGSIWFQDLRVWEKRNIVNQLFGVVLETPAFFPEFTALQNLTFFSKLCLASEDRIPELIYEVGLDKFPDTLFSQYSMGMKQRLNIANSMLHDPEVLIFDEPTNGLDPVGISDIRKLIQSFTSKGKTIILCSHILSEVEKICDRAILLKDGEVIDKIDIHGKLVDKKIFQIKYSDMKKLISMLHKIPAIEIISSDENKCIVEIDKNYDGSFINQKLAENDIYVSELISANNFESSVLDKITSVQRSGTTDKNK
ncbi:MAG: ABC transporter ATP-binding protein [Spirochaetia bacterium]|nr:ABC transporter ATP-binding protein [Spirochaetia bacterium]